MVRKKVRIPKHRRDGVIQRYWVALTRLVKNPNISKVDEKIIQMAKEIEARVGDIDYKDDLGEDRRLSRRDVEILTAAKNLKVAFAEEEKKEKRKPVKRVFDIRDRDVLEVLFGHGEDLSRKEPKHVVLHKSVTSKIKSPKQIEKEGRIVEEMGKREALLGSLGVTSFRERGEAKDIRGGTRKTGISPEAIKIFSEQRREMLKEREKKSER